MKPDPHTECTVSDGKLPRDPDAIVFVPPMEEFAAHLAAAVFRSEGVNARVLVENAETLAIGLQHTGGGECAPCPSTTGALIAAVQAERLPPEKVVFLMPTTCGPCRFGQYKELNRQIFKRQGWGAIRMLSPGADNSYGGLSAGTRVWLWRGMVMSDVLRKLMHRTRPYETRPGETDALLARHFKRILDAFEQRDKRAVDVQLKHAVAALSQMPTSARNRPLVGVVGEIYVRFNTFLNADLCRSIEQLGGEASVAPMSEWVLYTNALRRLNAEFKTTGLKGLPTRLRCALEHHLLFMPVERHYHKLAAPVLGDHAEPTITEVMNAGRELLPWHCAGETILTLGRAALFVTRDKAKAIVNASPTFCMPGTISSSIFPVLERRLNIPVVCNFYDGSGHGNAGLTPMMHYLTHPERGKPAVGR